MARAIRFLTRDEYTTRLRHTVEAFCAAYPHWRVPDPLSEWIEPSQGEAGGPFAMYVHFEAPDGLGLYVQRWMRENPAPALRWRGIAVHDDPASVSGACYDGDAHIGGAAAGLDGKRWHWYLSPAHRLDGIAVEGWCASKLEAKAAVESAYLALSPTGRGTFKRLAKVANRRKTDSSE